MAFPRRRNAAPAGWTDRHGVERTGLAADEVKTWRRAAEQIYIPYDQAAGIHLQDDDFLDQAPWDIAGTPPDRFPLLLHHHPLVIYRHQVIKQTDVVLATVMLPDRFGADERRRIFEFYDPLTTGDSSLSQCIQAIAAADAGHYRSAEDYLADAAAVDMADTAGNLRDGVHVASAGGVWMAAVYGFAGYRWRARVPEFSPVLARRGRRLCVPLLLRGSLLEVDIEEHQVTYRVRSGDPVTASHYGQEFTSPRDLRCRSRDSTASVTAWLRAHRPRRRMLPPIPPASMRTRWRRGGWPTPEGSRGRRPGALRARPPPGAG